MNVDRLYPRITEARLRDPEIPRRQASQRKRRDNLTHDGFLHLVAADHPARRVTAVGKDPLALADRRELLRRCVRVLQSPYVDGLMATQDLLEDLLILEYLAVKRKGSPFLNGKLLVLSLNRGGLSGSAWEMEDLNVGPLPMTCRSYGYDGAKLLLRLADDDPGSLRTLQTVAHHLRDLNALSLPVFLEPLPVERKGGKWGVRRDEEAQAKIVGVAQALGDSTCRMWLKLPYVEPFDRVAGASTLPILLLGGESAGSIRPFLLQLEKALAAGANVRGALVGRSVLFPGALDPLIAADAVGRLIHKRLAPEEALSEAERKYKRRGG